MAHFTINIPSVHIAESLVTAPKEDCIMISFLLIKFDVQSESITGDMNIFENDMIRR